MHKDDEENDENTKGYTEKKKKKSGRTKYLNTTIHKKQRRPDGEKKKIPATDEEGIVTHLVFVQLSIRYATGWPKKESIEKVSNESIL